MYFRDGISWAISVYYIEVDPLSILLLGGLYTCALGNEPSICDQQVRVFQQGGHTTALEVEYVGECGSMGPYTYYCSDDVCESPGIRFDLRNPTHYRWENLQYGFFCEFEKKNP